MYSIYGCRLNEVYLHKGWFEYGIEETRDYRNRSSPSDPQNSELRYDRWWLLRSVPTSTVRNYREIDSFEPYRGTQPSAGYRDEERSSCPGVHVHEPCCGNIVNFPIEFGNEELPAYHSGRHSLFSNFSDLTSPFSTLSSSFPN